jgi:hypothetical protein
MSGMDLADSVPLLEKYSAVILPVLVVAEQLGIPLPAVPASLRSAPSRRTDAVASCW